MLYPLRETLPNGLIVMFLFKLSLNTGKLHPTANQGVPPRYSKMYFIANQQG